MDHIAGFGGGLHECRRQDPGHAGPEHDLPAPGELHLCYHLYLVPGPLISDSELVYSED